MREKGEAPHRLQKLTMLSGFNSKSAMLSAPFVTLSLLFSMPAKALNAEPVLARQREQWQ
jgi:hypothetical protein